MELRRSPVFREIRQKFSSLIKDVDGIVRPVIESFDLVEISRLNVGYRAYASDRFRHFIENERNRFLLALHLITEDRPRGTVCDLGSFIPYLPVALASLGYVVKIVDKYEFYGDSFKNSLHRLAADQSIEVFDLDIVNDDFSAVGQNDVVTLMAVLEHLHGTPRDLMLKVHRIVSPDGFLLLEVPNFAEFSKRLRLLTGRSPLGDYEFYFESGYPFIGHNREMTLSEVVYLLERTGYEIQALYCYDYSVAPSSSTAGRVVALIKRLVPVKDKGQSIMAKARVRGCRG